MVSILFLGPMWTGSNALSMANGFRLAGHDVRAIDTSRINQLKRGTYDWLHQKSTGRRSPRALRALEAEVHTALKESSFDVLFCYKTVHLDQAALLNLPIPRKIHYSADDVSNPQNVTAEYLAYEQDWDVVVTTKRHNVHEIEKRGGAPLMIMSAYDPAWHHPHARLSNRDFLVGFIGNKRPDRVELVRRLARTYGKRMIVSGPGWKSDSELRSTGANLGSGGYGEDLAAAIANIQGNLVLLNSDNRDTHTCRSFEVPACGGLFVGPRTDEHQALLKDGEEAYLYSSEEELMEILLRVERDTVAARRTAEKGLARISADKHTYEDRAREVLEVLA